MKRLLEYINDHENLCEIIFGDKIILASLRHQHLLCTRNILEKKIV